MTSKPLSRPLHFTVTNQDTSEQDSSARLGLLVTPRRDVIETPNFIALSSRGVIPHLTPDVVLQHTRLGAVHLAIEDFVEKSSNGLPPIFGCPAGASTPLHAFTALPSSLLTVLAPRRTPAVAAPTGNSQKAISIFTSFGFRSLSSSDWAKYAEALGPDVVIGLADLSHGNVPGSKRIEKMADRTSSWLDELLAALKKRSNDNVPLPRSVFAPILPISIHSQSEYLDHLADDLADELGGIAFYSSSLVHDIPATTSLSSLPRLSLDEPTSPHQMLRQISLGMDLLTIPFINVATDAGLALTFEFPGQPIAPESAAGRIEDLALDLSLPCHATAITPLLPNCTCYTCTSHSRGYIHHLLSAKEMLAWVLLQIHNNFLISKFFSDIRESIREGRFEAGKTTFERLYESSLPEGGGQRPRARGYHFKSEGPGEPKKNKPAWLILADSSVGGRDIISTQEGARLPLDDHL